MTAWTWIWNSHSWLLTPEDEPGRILVLRGRYVRVEGRVSDILDRSRLTALRGSPGIIITGDYVKLSGIEHLMVYFPDGSALPAMGEQVTYSGRLKQSFVGRILLTSASRFKGESIAGLVVGAMGIFIFGLYLRAWLRERNTLASEPPQDMIG
jgi:hypothetical protein